MRLSARSSASRQRAALISRAPLSSHARTIGARSESWTNKALNPSLPMAQDSKADRVAASAKIHVRQLPRLVCPGRIDHVINRAGKFEPKFACHSFQQTLERGRFASSAIPIIRVCPAAAPGWRQSTEKLKA